MAEERILVLQANTTDFIYKHFNGNFFIPRQEAIERMAVGMCRFDCKDIEKECCSCNEWEKYDKLETLAEAALNALLEVEK